MSQETQNSELIFHDAQEFLDEDSDQNLAADAFQALLTDGNEPWDADEPESQAFATPQLFATPQPFATPDNDSIWVAECGSATSLGYESVIRKINEFTGPQSYAVVILQSKINK